jgi:hypothetical protein
VVIFVKEENPLPEKNKIKTKNSGNEGMACHDLLARGIFQRPALVH